MVAAQRDDLDHLLFSMPRSGGAAFVGDGGACRLRRLDTAVADFARPLDLVVRPGAAISLILPRLRLAPFIDVDALHGRFLAAATPAGALLGRHLLTLARIAPELRGDEAPDYVEATAHLAGACLAVRDTGSAPAVAARPGLGRKARDLIEASLHDPRLGPAMLVDRLNLSRSQLYRLFEPMGGVRHYITGRRLRCALELVTSRNTAGRRIGDIAYSLGFANDAHFSRIFHARFGMSPRTARAAARRGEGGWPPAPPAAPGGSPLWQWLRDLTLA